MARSEIVLEYWSTIVPSCISTWYLALVLVLVLVLVFVLVLPLIILPVVLLSY
jgi:hypothetical protein